MALAVKYDGWSDRRVMELFVRFAAACSPSTATLVKLWLTFDGIDSIGGTRSPPPG